MSLILLASYPKSGNTWMRALLSNVLAEDDEPVSINALVRGGIYSRHQFDEQLGLSSAAMTGDEILLHRPRFHESLAADADSPVFAKTHEPFQRLPDGAPLFAPRSFSGAVCIFRNPLDVAVSYAHHLHCGIGRAIEIMGNPEAPLAPNRNGINTRLPELVSDWGGNVLSWLDQKELPVRAVCYEDLHADTEAALAAVAAFAGLPSDLARLALAVENSSFHRLREQEKRVGFGERPPNLPNFFRKGRVGDWRSVLSRDQVRLVVERHGPAMARLGYLDEAERFLAADCRVPPIEAGQPTVQLPPGSE